jgi:hypothetical protein
MQQKKILCRPVLAALLLAAGGCGTAMASIVTYDLVGVTTAGGASLTGSFAYDSVFDSVTSVNIHEAADTLFNTAATTFTHVAGLLHFAGPYVQLLFDDGVNTLVMNTSGAFLGNPGPYTLTQSGAASISYIYVAAGGPAGNYNVVNGNFVAQAQVPEPASIGLAAIALLGAAASRRYRVS